MTTTRTDDRVMTMKAIVQDTYGPPDVLEVKEIDKAVVKDDEVLVRVHAAGVNAADSFIMRGVPYAVRMVSGLRRPRNGVRGTDVAGKVEAVGKDITRFQPGDEVFGWCKGSFAEYVCAGENNFVSKPANLTFEQAAAVPMAAFVALQALRDIGKVQPGQKVLINGASGGIGTFAVQIAKSYGAEVTGVCSTRNVDMVRSLGADHVIDYTQEDFTRSGQRYHFILDIVANHSLSDTRRALTPKGTLVPNSGTKGMRYIVKANLLSLLRQRTRTFVSSPKHEDLVVLKQLIEAGRVTPVIDRTYRLSETPEAIGYVEAGHTQGKVVVSVEAAIPA
jgi:NADPH:quinone reductase-like Zn-dependent oxidoreductase